MNDIAPNICLRKTPRVSRFVGISPLCEARLVICHPDESEGLLNALRQQTDADIVAAKHVLDTLL